MRISPPLLMLSYLLRQLEFTHACLIHPQHMNAIFKKNVATMETIKASGQLARKETIESGAVPKRLLRFPQAALKTISVVLVIYGVIGLFSPVTLHSKLFRHSCETLTRRVQVRYLAFAMREFIVALMVMWLSTALTFTRDTWKDHYIFSSMLILTEVLFVPYLFGCLGRDRHQLKTGLTEPMCLSV